MSQRAREISFSTSLFITVLLLERRSGCTYCLEDHILRILIDNVRHDDTSQPRWWNAVLRCSEQERLPCHFGCSKLTLRRIHVAVLESLVDETRSRLRAEDLRRVLIFHPGYSPDVSSRIFSLTGFVISDRSQLLGF